MKDPLLSQQKSREDLLDALRPEDVIENDFVRAIADNCRDKDIFAKYGTDL